METLKSACDSVISKPDLRPEKDKKGRIVRTHCNQAARLIAQALGCQELDNQSLCADDMADLMDKNASGLWKKVDGRAAALQALNNALAFAVMKSGQLNEQHGHIVAIYPLGMQLSGSLGRDVPMCANVGIRVGVEKISEAFPVKSVGEPAYYCWR